MCLPQSYGVDSPAVESLIDEIAPIAELGVEIVLVVGTDDTECEPWQSQDATDDLQAAGYDARLVEIDGGNHFTVIFHDFVNNEWLILPGDPTGRQVVDVILEAIEGAGSSEEGDWR